MFPDLILRDGAERLHPNTHVDTHADTEADTASLGITGTSVPLPRAHTKVFPEKVQCLLSIREATLMNCRFLPIFHPPSLLPFPSTRGQEEAAIYFTQFPDPLPLQPSCRVYFW